MKKLLVIIILPIIAFSQSEWTVNFTIEKPDSTVFARGFGIASGATDGYDIFHDLPLFIGSSDTNAFFPVTATFISALSVDIRSNRVSSHRWNMVFRYMPTSLVSWLTDSIPSEGLFEISVHPSGAEPTVWTDMRTTPSAVVATGSTISFRWSIPSGEDSIPPVISAWHPPDGAINVPRETNIYCEITDVGSGVDRSSIQMTVNGIPVIWLSEMDTILNGFSLNYSPIIPFGWATTVTVIVSAMDNAVPSNYIIDTVQWRTLADSLAFTVSGIVGTGEPFVPVPDAIVTISTRTDTTDISGNFSFDSIAEGAYTLRAQAVGYEQRTLYVYIFSDTTFRISLTPISPPDILVIDYDSGSNPFGSDTLGEEDIVASILNFLGYDFIVTAQNPDISAISLDPYRIIVLITPVRGAIAHEIISDMELDVLSERLLNNGRILWIAPDAGRDYYNGTSTARSFFEMFGARYDSDGRPASPVGNVARLFGNSSDFYLSTNTNYSMNSPADNYLDEFSPANSRAFIALASQDSAPAPLVSSGRTIFYDNYTYRTVISSFLFGGIVDGIFPNTRNNLFSGCMRFLERTAGIFENPRSPEKATLKIYPNPFNSTCRIETEGVVEILDISGRSIKKMESQKGMSVWDGTDNYGEIMPSGVYFVREIFSSRSATIVYIR